MDNTTFSASVVSCEENAELSTVGFADDQYATSQYVLLQRAHHPSQQDLKLGIAGLHVEVNDQLHSGYDEISSISLKRDFIHFDFGERFFKRSGIKSVSVFFCLDDHKFAQLCKSMQLVVGNQSILSIS
ncbi:MAG: Imm10 family immunity protein [Pirellulales bacterium]